jgi:glycogen(starch) synthase
MRVLMTADAVGGVWTYALDLSAALAQHDISVVLATMGPRPNDAQRAAGEWLLDLANDAAVDMVHLNGYSHAALPWGRPVVCVAHSCVVTWWQAVYREQPPGEWDTYRRNVTRGLNRADLVIAPTHALLEQVQSCYGFKQPCKVIRNGRPQNILSHSVPVQTEARSGRREPLLLGCGRLWDAAKNLSVFDAAAEGLPWPAYVIGDTSGPDGQTFSPQALRTLGPLSHDDVESWLQRASIFVHPALYEPFGLAVLEAAAAGCALVLSDIPTLRELWNGAAEFHDPGDSAQLHHALNALIADSAKRNALAAAAQRRAAEYSVDSMAAAYAQLYRSLGRSNNARAVA